MSQASLTSFKEEMKSKGFVQKAVVSDEEMNLAKNIFDSQEGIVQTPAEELRYIEGLLRLPFGYINQFAIQFPKGQERCVCGRESSALDIVNTALKKRIHDEAVIRDTIIGLSNIIELSDDGRSAECFDCGRPIFSTSYRTRAYLYA
jgi:hypothetical protein